MKKRRLIPVLCAAAVTASLAGCSGGLGSVTDKGADTQATKAEAGAEKGRDEDSGARKGEEGVTSKDEELITYSPLTEFMIDSMLAMFEEDTGIDAERLAVGTGDALKRIQIEADNSRADIFWLGTIGAVENKSEYFADYTISNEDVLYGEYKNTEGNLARFDIISSVIMVNTDLISDIRMEGYEDLLNSELKGKIIFADPAASSSSFEHLVNMLYAMGGGNPDNGWDYVKQFCAQLDGKLLGGSSAVYKGVADGEYIVGLTFEQDPAQHTGTGAPVKTVHMSGGVIFRGDGIYIIKGCPNESNAQKFVDQLTSKDVREFMNNTQYRRTIRKDVEAGDAMAPMDQIKVIQNDETGTAARKSEQPDELKELFTEQTNPQIR